uniref:tetratricopeptide repeat protein n=1 Tax=Altererythrobacter segetis TaxID=1104773 RepID=UPI00140C833C|nr:SEL1-like repeat protein [Altererythrobacter segetis]
MKGPNLGENLSREWDEDPRSPELWDALKLAKSCAEGSPEKLIQLAENGSPLAMMYLGSAYIVGKYGLHPDHDTGEYWLMRSAAAGSIEGAHRLAVHSIKAGNPSKGLAEFRRLADLGYSPALAALALEYDKGRFVDRDVNEALRYYRLAEKRGHLLASNQICFILMRWEMGPLSWARGLLKRMKLLIPFTVAYSKYPRSDRFVL